MNKSQLIAAIAEQSGLSLAKAEKTLSATLEVIAETIGKNDTVSLVGFGNFGTKVRSARKGRNPQTGTEILIKESTIPYFKAGKGLKEAVDDTKSN